MQGFAGYCGPLKARSFLFVRIKQNPEHYAIPGATSNQPSSEAWEEWIRWYVEVSGLLGKILLRCG
jgi:hypothetical protein